MAIKNTKIASTTTTQVFATTTSTQAAITTMIFCNTDAVTDTSVDVYVVPFGKNATPGTQIMKELSLAATETFVLDTERLILEGGDAIYAQATVGDIVTVTVSSIQTS